MKKFGWRKLAAAAALGMAAALPAQAGLVTFEDLLPSGYFVGDNFSSGGFSFSVGGLGFGLVDEAAAFSLFGNAPTGSTGQFFAALNDSSLTVSGGAVGLISISGFDFSFVAPIGGIGGPDAVGRLLAAGVDALGAAYLESWEFGVADANGDYGFSTQGATGALAGGVRSATFTACVYDASANCVFPANNQAQFAIDNIRAQLPEPTSPALVALGLALALAGTARRRNAH